MRAKRATNSVRVCLFELFVSRSRSRPPEKERERRRRVHVCGVWCMRPSRGVFDLHGLNMCVTATRFMNELIFRQHTRFGRAAAEWTRFIANASVWRPGARAR